MSFELFGFEFIETGSICGFWFGMVKKCDSNRCLFCLHQWEGNFTVDLCWFRLIGD